MSNKPPKLPYRPDTPSFQSSNLQRRQDNHPNIYQVSTQPLNHTETPDMATRKRYDLKKTPAKLVPSPENIDIEKEDEMSSAEALTNISVNEASSHGNMSSHRKSHPHYYLNDSGDRQAQSNQRRNPLRSGGEESPHESIKKFSEIFDNISNISNINPKSSEKPDFEFRNKRSAMDEEPKETALDHTQHTFKRDTTPQNPQPQSITPHRIKPATPTKHSNSNPVMGPQLENAQKLDEIDLSAVNLAAQGLSQEELQALLQESGVDLSQLDNNGAGIDFQMLLSLVAQQLCEENGANIAEGTDQIVANNVPEGLNAQLEIENEGPKDETENQQTTIGLDENNPNEADNKMQALTELVTNLSQYVGDLGDLGNLDISQFNDPDVLNSISQLIEANPDASNPLLNILPENIINSEEAPNEAQNTESQTAEALQNQINLEDPNILQALTELSSQNPELIATLSQAISADNITSLLNSQESSQVTNQHSNSNNYHSNPYPSGPSRYPQNPNYRNRNGFSNQYQSNPPHWDNSRPRYQNRNPPVSYEDTVNFDNNPLGGRRPYNNYNNNSSNTNYQRPLMTPYNRRPNNLNSNTNNRFPDRRGPYNQNYQQNQSQSTADGYQRSHQERENLLDVPLNEIANGSNLGSKTNSMSNLVERGFNHLNKDSRAKGEMQEENLNVTMPSYYSDKLGLEEQYFNDKETPITKTLRKTLVTAEIRKDTIATSIDQFEDNLERFKKSFFSLQPGFDLDKLDEKINELRGHKENKKSILKKTIKKITPRKNSRSVKKKPSKQPEETVATFFDRSAANFDPFSRPQEYDALCGPLSSDKIDDAFVREVVEKELKICPDEDQINAIKSIHRRESCIYRYSTIHSKMVVCQGSALVSTGIAIYIHPSSSYLLGQLQSLPQSVSGGCLGSFIARDRASQHLEAAKAGNLDILFTTPEKFFSENLVDILDIAFICLDEAQCIPESSSNFKVSSYDFVKNLRRKLKSIPILAPVSPVTSQTCEELSKILSIPAENIFPKDFLNTTTHNITISRDDDKGKALIKLLETPKYKNIKDSMIFYTECKRSVEDLTEFLMNSGYKAHAFHSGKNERIETLSHIMKNNEGILVSTSNTEIGIDKKFPKCVIHYTMPKSLEIYVQEVSRVNDKVPCHMFLHDEDYCMMRLGFRSEMIERDQLEVFVMKILEAGAKKELLNGESGRAGAGKKKNDGENMVKGGAAQKSERMDEEETDKKEEKDETCMINVDELCYETDLKKETIVQLFEYLDEQDDWIVFCGVASVVCTVKILLEKKVVGGSLKHDLLRVVAKNINKDSGMYKFAIAEVAASLNCTPNEVTKTLKNLQNEGIVNYEVVEEAFCYKLIFDPNPVRLIEKIQEMHRFIEKKGMTSIHKLDLMYAAARASSFQSIAVIREPNKSENDKQAKPSNTTNQSQKDVVSTSPAPGDKNNGSSEKKKGRLNLTDFFEKYLNYKEEECGGYDAIWDNPSKIRDTVPLVKVHGQREKSNITADAKSLVDELFNELMPQDANPAQEQKAWDPEVLKARLTRGSVKIMQGLQIFASKREWKTHIIWRKYYKYDYSELYEVVGEVVSSYLVTKNLKKVKISGSV